MILLEKIFIWFTEQLINKYGKDIISKAVFKAMRESKNKIVVFQWSATSD